MRYPLNARTRQRAHRDIDASPDGYFFAPPVEPSATLATKRKMWAMLGDVARQKRWPVILHAVYALLHGEHKGAI